METYPPRPLVHMQSSFDPYSAYAHPPHNGYAPATHAHGLAAYPPRASHDPEYCDRSTAFGNLASGDRDVLLSPSSLPESSARRSPSPGLARRPSSLDMSPGRAARPRVSQPQPGPRPVHAAYPVVSPPSLVRSFYATQSPPDCRIATPPCDSMSSLMQLATAAETDHAKTRPTAPLSPSGAPYAPVPHRLPSLRSLLNGTPSGASRFSSSPRPICG
jgi:hypothetical protein